MIVDKTEHKEDLLGIELDAGVDKKDTFSFEGKEYLLEDGNALDEAGKVFKTKEEIELLSKPADKEDLIKLDDKGNSIGEDGKIIKTKEELEKEGKDEPKDDEVEIPGEGIFKVDDKGNVLNADGTIKYTADQLEETSKEDNEEGNLDISSIQELTKIVPTNQQGQKIVYNNDTEGLSAYIKDVYTLAEAEHKQDSLTELVNRFPAIENVINHLTLNNGKLDGFKAGIDYSNIKLEPTNEEQLSNIIKESRKAKGDSDETTAAFLSYAKDSNKLFDIAKSEHEFLKSKQTADKETLQRQIEEQDRIQMETFNNTWGVKYENNKIVDLNKPDSIYHKMVKEGKFMVDGKPHSIPEKLSVKNNGKLNVFTREDLFNYAYMPQPVKIGDKTEYLTGYELDQYTKSISRTSDNDISDILNSFLNYDLSQVITETVNKESVNKIRKQVKLRKASSSGKDEKQTQGKKEIDFSFGSK